MIFTQSLHPPMARDRRFGRHLFFCFVCLFFAFSGCLCTGEISNPSSLSTDLPQHRMFFDDVALDKPQIQALTLFVKGGNPIEITSIELEHTRPINGKSAFSLPTPPTLPKLLYPGKDAGLRLLVSFFTKKQELYEARLKIHAKEAKNSDAEGFFYVTLRHQSFSALPKLTCTQNPLDFGVVFHSKFKAITCKLHNQGTAPLHLIQTKYTPKEGDAADFRWVRPGLPAQIPPNQTIEFQTAFHPQTLTPKNASGSWTLHFSLSGEKDTKPLTFEVIGQKATPRIEIVVLYPPCTKDSDCPHALNFQCKTDDFDGAKRCLPSRKYRPAIHFPFVGVGEKTQLRIAIRSIGNTPLQLDDISLLWGTHDFELFRDPFPLPLQLAPKEERFISITYHRKNDFPSDGNLQIQSNGQDWNKATIPITISKTGCAIQTSTRQLHFSQNSVKSVLLQNIGKNDCLLQKVFLESKTADSTSNFSFLRYQPPLRTLKPAETLEISVRFESKDENEHKAFINIQSNDANEPTIGIKLTAQNAKEACKLSFTPTLLDFQWVPSGQSKTLSLSIQNKGLSDCIIQSPLLEGDGPDIKTLFQLTSQGSFPHKLGSGESLALELRYTPQGASLDKARLVLTTEDGTKTDTLKIDLMGASGGGCLLVLPQKLDFGEATLGCKAEHQRFDVYHMTDPQCPKEIEIESLGFTLNPDNVFRVEKAPQLPVKLQPGSSFSVSLSYQHTQKGSPIGSFRVESKSQKIVFDLPIFAKTNDATEQTDTFTQLQRPLVDILWVIDNSSSMGIYQQNLANNFNSFINWAARLNQNYHIGVTTTDTSGKLHPPGCLVGSTKIITEQTPSLIKIFAQNVKVGTQGSSSEQGLEATKLALSAPRLNDPKCNKGFTRADASLSIIIVSDEIDQSPQTVSFYVNFFKSIKGFRDLDQIRLGVIGPHPPNSPQCASGSCRYYEVSKQLGGIYQHIKSANWVATLSNLGSLIFGYRTRFFLSRRPDPQTIIVTVNGQPVKNNPQDGWTYEPTSNSIHFSKSQVPPPGGLISIKYQILCHL